MCVSSRTAQAEEPSEQGEGGDDEDQAWFVCPFRVCSDFASKAARRDVEEQAASAQTTDLVEDATKASESAVGMRFCSWTIADCGRSAAEEQGGSGQTPKADMFGKHGRKITGKHPCTWQDLAVAKRRRNVALSRLERAEELAAYLQKQLLELEDSSSERADEVKQELKDAETKLQDAETKLPKLEKAEQKYEAKASVQAGRGQAGASACAVVAVDFGLQHSRMVVVRFRAVHHCCLLGSSCSPLSKGPLVVKLCSLCWLAAQRGAACFALALRSPGCGCFCLRLDFQVERGGVKGVNPGCL